MLRKIQEAEELRDCTFRPSIRPSAVQGNSAAADKCADLYMLAKRQLKRSDKSTDDYLLEKAPGEYTFAPNTIKPMMPAKGKRLGADRTVQESVERMKRGRAERERRKELAERGCSASKKSGKKAAENKENERPMLYIDISMKGRQERITVKQGDTAKALARVFSTKHSMKRKERIRIGLDAETESKLEGLIEMQMREEQAPSVNS